MTDPKAPSDYTILYEELGHNYRYFLGWRERLFAGYLTVLAGLGLGFANAGRASFEIGLLAMAVLVSIVFRLLDWRTRDLFCRCQAAARDIEARMTSLGAYTALDQMRQPTRTLTTHSFGINLLVGGVASGALAGILARAPAWFSPQRHALPCAAAALAFVVIVALLERRRPAGSNWALPLPSQPGDASSARPL